MMILRFAPLALLISGAAAAEAPWTPPAEIRGAAPADPKPKSRPVAAFGEDHPDCAEWTDGCLVCRRQESGDPACSMPGVACLPAEPACVNASSNNISAPSNR